MDQAFIITAYKDVNTLNKLILRLIPDFYVFVHIDKKSQIKKSDIVSAQNVYCYSRYKVNWGSFNHLKSILYLLRCAIRKTNSSYFHIISAQDYPCVSNESIIDFFKEKKYESFFDVELALNNDGYKDRYRYYWFTDWIAHPRNWDLYSNKLISKFIRFQKRKKIERRYLGFYKIKDLYKGLVYVSLDRNAAKYSVRFSLRRYYFLLSLKFCLVPEEFYFQTLLMNSSFKSTINNNNLRYMEWSYRDGISPCVLDERDYENVINSKALFMRKVSEKSEKLIKMLE